jgi:twitching motility protein PilT
MAEVLEMAKKPVMAPEPTKTNETRELLKSLAQKIPRAMSGVDRQEYIGMRLLKELPDDKIVELQNYYNTFLQVMRDKIASDIDMGGWGSKGYVWLRIHGAKMPIEVLGKFSNVEMDILIQSLLMENQKKALYKNRNLDFSYNYRSKQGESQRYRADAYFETNCLALNMRAINTKIFPYETYQFHRNVTKMLSLTHTKEGLVLCTGITGSGKSTTLDSVIDMNNRTAEGHVVIIASPIEFVHESKKCLVRHREVGRDTMSFKSGTVEALRQDPDIIMIGEMRDPDTIMAALEVADSGHKVFSTLHTSSAVESIDRIVGEVPTGEQERVRNRLADTLRCVISQKLVPTISGERILAKEILIMTPSVRSAILNNNIGEIYQMISQSIKDGMRTIEQDLVKLFIDKKISLSTAMNYANNKRRIEQILKISNQGR